MRAQVLTAFGGPENFKLTEIPKPKVSAGTVLVRIAATSVNQVDTKVRTGLPISPDLPAVLGCDVAGTVEEVGAGVLDFAPGDAVYSCMGGVKGQGGGLADYILADARLLAPKPASLTMREAAALPLVAITAWEALERAALTASDHVLVHGGVGGVGHIAVQLAKAAGARVATTVASPEAAALASSLGADETINYRDEKVADYVNRLTAGRGFDVVFDTIGGDNLQPSFVAAAECGRVATTNARTTQDLVGACTTRHCRSTWCSCCCRCCMVAAGTGTAESCAAWRSWPTRESCAPSSTTAGSRWRPRRTRIAGSSPERRGARSSSTSRACRVNEEILPSNDQLHPHGRRRSRRAHDGLRRDPRKRSSPSSPAASSSTARPRRAMGASSCRRSPPSQAPRRNWSRCATARRSPTRTSAGTHGSPAWTAMTGSSG